MKFTKKGSVHIEVDLYSPFSPTSSSSSSSPSKLKEDEGEGEEKRERGLSLSETLCSPNVVGERGEEGKGEELVTLFQVEQERRRGLPADCFFLTMDIFLTFIFCFVFYHRTLRVNRRRNSRDKQRLQKKIISFSIPQEVIFLASIWVKLMVLLFLFIIIRVVLLKILFFIHSF